jgi:ligand-binding sensor domain-containing protein
VGTSGGLIRYDTESDKYRLYDLRSGLLANGIFYIGHLKGRLAVGTYGGGLSLMRQDGESWDTYNVPHGLADAFIYDALETDAGDIWIATWSGANRVRGGALDDPEAWETYTVANTDGGLPNDWVYALDKGADGTIWFATEGGLARMKDGRWTSWNHEDGQGADYELVKDQLQFKNDPADYSEHHRRQKEEMGLQDVNVAYNPNYIVALHVDPDNTVWAGTWGGGLAKFADGMWTNYTANDGLPANHIFSLHRDPAGVLWVGTSAGLSRFEPGPPATYTTADGLFSNQVFALATTDDGTHWVGSFGGVARITELAP